MSRVLYALGMAAAIALVGCSREPQQPQAAAEPASEQFDAQSYLSQWPPVDISPPELSFGQVLVGEPTTRTVDLTNRGDRELRIVTSKTNCGCTTADLAGTLIGPGETVPVEIHFDAEGKLGERSATVSLTFLDYPRPVMFRISAFVVAGAARGTDPGPVTPG
jgi:hypothetical protein